MDRQQISGGHPAFSRQLRDPSLRLNFTQEADPFFRRCALGVWAQGGPITEKHVAVYNAIHSGSNLPPQALYFEVASSAAAAPVFQPPGFFLELTGQDRGPAADGAISLQSCVGC